MKLLYRVYVLQGFWIRNVSYLVRSDITLYPGLPDGLFSNQKSHLEGLRLENVYIFYGHLECLMDIFDILWPSGTFYFMFIWYIFPFFLVSCTKKNLATLIVSIIQAEEGRTHVPRSALKTIAVKTKTNILVNFWTKIFYFSLKKLLLMYLNSCLVDIASASETEVPGSNPPRV
jgi:hypothetical protein